MAFLLHPAMIVVLAGVATYLATGLVIRRASALRLVQRPNARSSHVMPTPSGGGIGIACGSIAMGLWTVWAGGLPFAAILSATLAIAALGLADDLGDLSARLRLILQACILGGLLAALRPLPDIAFAGVSLAPILVAAILLVAGLWWVNLFNFMDGIDGLAAGEAVFVLLSAAVLAWLAHDEVAMSPLWWWMIGGAISSAAFLLHNWPPARVFMGDIGSNHLALLILALAVASASAGLLDLWVWATLVSLFVSDATVTLVRRLKRGVRVFDAHREHGYQRLARRWGGHRPVTVAYMAANALWVLPFAVLGITYPAMAWLICLGAYAPAVLCAWFVGAGLPE